MTVLSAALVKSVGKTDLTINELRHILSRMKSLFGFSGLLVVFGSVFITPQSLADRHFTFPYESYTEAPGVIEAENHVLGALRRVDGRIKFGLDVHNELEFGVARDFQLGIYYANWSYRSGQAGDRTMFRYESAAVEAKYRLMDEHKGQPFGLAFLGEVAGGRRFLGLETRVIADKRLGRWQAVYNLIVESEWEDVQLRSRTITLGQSAGLRYDLAPSLSLGMEGRYEAGFPNRGESTSHTVFAGPVVSYHVERVYVTASAAFQVTDVREQPRFFPRVIFGFKF